MIRTKQIVLPIYKRNIMLVECTKLKHLKKLFSPYNINGFDFDYEFTEDDSIYAHTIKGEVYINEHLCHCIYLIFNPKHSMDMITPGVIAHECLHAMHMIYHAIGAEVEDIRDGEKDAYLLEYLVNLVHDFLDKK